MSDYVKYIKGPWSWQTRSCPCNCDTMAFHRYHELLDKFEGDKNKVKLHVAGWLRVIADHLERGGYPDIMNSNVPLRNPDKPCNRDHDMIVETFEVTLSHLWGG